MAYATENELLTYTGRAAIDDATRLLERASEVIDDAIGKIDVYGATYTFDVAETEALQDATCAQVEFWLEVAEEHDIIGDIGAIQAPGMFSAEHSPAILAPRAQRRLMQAQLVTQPGMK